MYIADSERVTARLYEGGVAPSSPQRQLKPVQWTTLAPSSHSGLDAACWESLWGVTNRMTHGWTVQQGRI